MFTKFAKLEVQNLIVQSSDPITLVGGADIGPNDLNIALAVAPSLVAADSGANHLLAEKRAPTAIFGDFDSISEGARAAFSEVLHCIEDQNTTDFQKVLARVDAPFFVAVGFLGGRIDHSFAALHAVTVAKSSKVVFLAGEDVAIVVRDERIKFEITPGLGFAVLPLDQCRVSTSGLKWDLDNASLGMTHAISSSNKVENSTVTVAVDGAAVVTMPRSAFDAVINAVRAG